MRPNRSSRVRTTAIALLCYAASLGAMDSANYAVAQQPPADAGLGIISKGADSEAACFIDPEIAPDLRKVLSQMADATWQRLADKDVEKLWRQAHPRVRESHDQEQFTKLLSRVSENLGKRPPGSRENMFVLRFTGDYRGVAICGSTDSSSDQYSALQVNSAGEPLAIVVRRSVKIPFQRSISLSFRGSGKSWALAGVSGSDVAFSGRGAAHFLDAARDSAKVSDHLSELTALEVARAFSKPAPFVETAASLRIASRLKELTDNADKLASITTWRVGEHMYEIPRVIIESRESTLRPVIAYRSRFALESSDGAEEARALAAHLRRAHPQLAEQFQTVMLEAVDAPLPGGRQAYASKRYLESLVE